MAEAAKWYVVHTYSGYENTVKATIEKTIETRHLEDLIHIVSIPMETVTEITDNGPKTYDRKVFPGYVLIKMIMSDEAWYIIKNVRGVTGFVGSGTKPTPLTEEEVQQLGIEKHEIVVAYSEGDSVRINEFIEEEKRPVQFRHMIYFGDGTTDIPCMKLVKQQGGHSIAVYNPRSRQKRQEMLRLIRDNRVNYVCPADYGPDKEIDRLVKMIIDKIVVDYQLSKSCKA